MKSVKIFIYFIETFIIVSISIITIIFAINCIKRLFLYIFYGKAFEWADYFLRISYAPLYSLIHALLEIGDNLECSQSMKYKSDKLDKVNEDLKKVLEGMHWKLTFENASQRVYKLPHLRTFRFSTNKMIVNYNENIINFIGRRGHINDLIPKLNSQNFLNSD